MGGYDDLLEPVMAATMDQLRTARNPTCEHHPRESALGVRYCTEPAVLAIAYVVRGHGQWSERMDPLCQEHWDRAWTPGARLYGSVAPIVFARKDPDTGTWSRRDEPGWPASHQER